jgi:3-deoxy-D-manno-octulosonic-acid transferase
MLRLIYTAMLYVAAPIAFAVLLWRGLRDPLYRDRRLERFGFSRTRLDAAIWVHAVSVGEVQAAASLIRELQKRYPESPLIVTTATPTGAQRVRALFPQAVHHAYLPYDLPGAVSRFLERIRPRVAVILETEVWPNLYRACGRRRIPIVLASARLSEKSVRRFRRIGGLFRDALNRDLVIGAQSQADAGRFLAVGAAPSRTHVTGNIKFDLAIPPGVRVQGETLRAEQFAGRFAWVAGSTHEGEEGVILEAHRILLASRGDSLLILVPRHPNRFDRVRQWLAGQRVTFVSRSRGESATPATQVLLVDTLGELMLFYAASDVAFVGGSLVPIGGHNLLEPAALARPILTGPQNFNAPDIARLMLENGAALRVDSGEGLAHELEELAANPARRMQMGTAALAMLENNRGALERVMGLVAASLQRGTH